MSDSSREDVFDFGDRSMSRATMIEIAITATEASTPNLPPVIRLAPEISKVNKPKAESRPLMVTPNKVIRLRFHPK